MKKLLFSLLALLMLTFSFNANATEAQVVSNLMIDFDAASTQAMNYQSFNNCVDSDPSKFTPAVYNGISLGGSANDITVTLSVTSGVTGGNFAFRSNTVTNSFSTPAALANDVVGINASSSDTLFITIAGLPAGSYRWKSYHHGPWWGDHTVNLNMNFFNGDSEIKSVSNIDQSGYSSTAIGSALTSVTVDGVTPLVVALSNTSSSAGWVLISGFDITELSSANDILIFNLQEKTAPAVINTTKHTVDIEVANGTDVTALSPVITVSEGAVITPASATLQNFTDTVHYTVKAENGAEQVWDIVVTAAASLSNENDITEFSFVEQTGAAQIDDTIGYTVKIQVKNDADVSNLIPTIKISGGATITPASGVGADFSDTVSYVVKAQNGDERTWKVIVSVQSMLSASINGSAWVSNGFNWNAGEFSAGDTITMSLTGNGSGNVFVNLGTFAPWAFIEYNIDSVVTSLFVKDTIDVKIVVPSTAKSYQYLVNENGFAANGYWLIQAIETGGRYCNFKFFVKNNNDITKFTITDDATIKESDSTISLIVPNGTNISALSPVIELSEGATVSPASGVQTDFTNPVTYTVTGKNGAVKEYTVTVTVSVSSDDEEVSSAVIYPNPSNGMVNIELSEVGANIVVVNIAGNVIYKQNNVTSNIVTLNSLKAGMYIVYINNIATKLVVE